MSQAEAAEACQVSRQLWAAWEVRTRPITLQQAQQIADVLHLSNAERLELLEWGSAPLERREHTDLVKG